VGISLPVFITIYTDFTNSVFIRLVYALICCFILFIDLKVIANRGCCIATVVSVS
jgi:hypothetical protein